MWSDNVQKVAGIGWHQGAENRAQWQPLEMLYPALDHKRLTMIMMMMMKSKYILDTLNYHYLLEKLSKV